MTMRTFMGLCAALAFAVGSTAVHAVKIIDTTGASPGTEGHDSVTYAMETLLKGDANVVAANDEDDKTAYYKIVRSHIFAAPAGIAASPGDNYLVTYRLEGMVFSGAATITPSAQFSLISGGSAGHTTAVFRTTALGAVAATAVIEMQATVAVSEGGGSITRTVLNRSLEGIPGVDASESHTAMGIIKFAPALNEMVVKASPAPEAKAAAGFMKFGVDPDVLRVSLGTVVLGVVDSPENLRDAQGADSNADLIDALGDITAAARVADTDPITNRVTFSGDFSFAKTVALGVGGCAGTLTEIRKSEGTGDDMMLLNETMPMEALTFGADAAPTVDGLDDDGNQANDDTPFHLCVEVDGMKEIPETPADNPFQVMATYKGMVDNDGEVIAAHVPMGDDHDLASIGRDGASFSIPYLTVNDAYNQRIILVNRGSEAKYTFGNFQAAGDGIASAGPMATGQLPTGQTVLRSTAIVEVAGGNVASATLSIVTDQANISAAIQQRHLMEGTVDTVYLD